MAQQLAPYNNSMRLGQGFNSYTQQICLDRAVLRSESVTAKVLSVPQHHQASSGQSNLESSEDDYVIRTFADYDSEIESGNEGRRKPQKPDRSDKSKTGNHDGDSSLIRRNQESREVLEGGRLGDHDYSAVPDWVKPQIVTYSSRFVEKISDVTDAMNVSGSLSIKTAQVGGKANGSYVDSDKFKSSDINFHLQVKVTNQIQTAPEFDKFNKLDGVDKTNITQIYGDTFISGFETGGELNAIISVKVRDKSKIFEIKAGLEGELNTPSLAGKVEVKFGMEKNSLSRNTETTIAVNWSGGGSIKDPNEDWTITSLKKAAAAFPELVAMTPQKTYAILTKYTSLYSYQIQMKDCSPLQYENAGIYTGALLDSYMDFKVMWKQISHATFELKNRRARIEMAKPGEDVYALAKVEALPETRATKPDDKGVRAKALMGPAGQAPSVTGGDEVEESSALSMKLFSSAGTNDYSGQEKVTFRAFDPSFAGLIAARKVCRVEMSKIVDEVDLIAKDPSKATDTRRDEYFLNSLIFEQLLPVVHVASPEDLKLGKKDPNAPMLLGYVKPEVNVKALPKVYLSDGTMTKYDNRLAASIQRHEARAENYRLQGTAGNTETVHSLADIFNDLDSLNATFRLVKVAVYYADSRIKGIMLQYHNGTDRKHGVCNDKPSHELQLRSDGAELISEVLIQEGRLGNGSTVITRIAFATTACNVMDTEIPQPPKSGSPSENPKDEKNTKKEGENTGNKPEPPPKDESKPKPPAISDKKTHHFSIKEGEQWSLRGFFGFSHESSIIVLGVVWGNDVFVPVPMVPMQNAMCRSFITLSSRLQANIRRFTALPKLQLFCEKFVLGKTVDTIGPSQASVEFNAMDTIDVNWKIRSIGFASVGNKLRGLRVTYTNDVVLEHGKWTQETQVWLAVPKSDLVVAKLTAGAIKGTSEKYIDTLEFVCAELSGHLPIWPFETSTLRYLGEKDVRVTEDVSVVIERAPRAGNLNWSVRGFYGEASEGVITSLGLVWGSG